MNKVFPYKNKFKVRYFFQITGFQVYLQKIKRAK
jgi:hypothetical protein